MTLLSRVEALTGADRDVDAELLKAFDDEHNTITRFFDSITGWEEINGLGSKTYSHPAPLTGAVDAALAFAEKVLPGIWWHIAKGRMKASEPLYACALLFGSDDVVAKSEASTAPLAIILAVLRAKEGT